MDQPASSGLPGTVDLQAGALDRQVAFVSYRWPHLSRSSGYDRLVGALGGKALELPRPAFPLAERLAARLERSTMVDRYYTRRFRRRESLLIKTAPREPRRLYHFLYGESAFRRFKKARPEKRVIASFHQPPSILERYVTDPHPFGDLDAAILLGNNQRPFFEQYLPADKIQMIPHGIDTAAFVPPRDRTSLKRLLFVGVWLRDFITARRVMERLARADKAIHLDVVTLPKCAAHFFGLDNVKIHCGISELELLGLYQRSALLFLPLKDGTFNNAIGEAIACGLPVVSSDVGGIGDYVNDECSVLHAAGEVDAYVDTLRALLDDPDRCAALTRAARARAEELDWSRVVPAVRRVYEFAAGP